MTGSQPDPRLDSVLVRRGLARSRGRAVDLVRQGRVQVDGDIARKPSQPVPPPASVRVDGPGDGYVSRAAHKLRGALEELEVLAPGRLVVAGARCLDAGAAAGGFTQVLLERGAAHVEAVDVGHGQLDPVLAADPRVTSREGLNVRDLDRDLVGPVDLVVADLSFISLAVVIGALVAVVAPGGSLLVMVKPQFEVGRARLGGSGVVTSPRLRAGTVVAVAESAAAAGVGVRAVVPSPLPGSAGNREYFLWLAPGEPGADLAEIVREAVDTGRPVLASGSR